MVREEAGISVLYISTSNLHIIIEYTVHNTTQHYTRSNTVDMMVMQNPPVHHLPFKMPLRMSDVGCRMSDVGCQM